MFLLDQRKNAGMGKKSEPCYKVVSEQARNTSVLVDFGGTTVYS
jgi:hypothetical protein